MAVYLSDEQFRQTYRPKKNIGSGSFGSVYLTDVIINGTSVSQAAVKTFYSKDQKENDELLESFTNELNFYQYLSHPHLCSAIAWTINSVLLEGLIVLPVGIPLENALQNRYLTWEDLIKQILLALDYLHANGVAHGDLKPANVLFFPSSPTNPAVGLVKLIDFGLTRQAQLIQYTDDPVPRYYITDTAYTPGFRDPEYSKYDWNPIEVELYALAYTLYYLHQKMSGLTVERTLYIFRTGIPIVDLVIGDCTIYPAKTRPTVRMLLDAWSVTPIKGEIRTTPIIPLVPNCQRWEIEILDQAVIFAGDTGGMRKEHEEYPARLLFLMLHLMHRSLRLIFPSRPPQFHIDLYVLACYFMVENTVFSNHPTLDDHLKFIRLPVTAENRKSFLAMYQHILMEIGGVIGGINTFWEAALSGSELPTLLEDTVSCYYNPNSIRRPHDYDGTSKLVSSSIVVNSYLKLFSEHDSAFNSGEDTEDDRRISKLMGQPPSDRVPALIVPVYLQHSPPSMFDFSTTLTAMVQSPKKLRGEDITLLLRNPGLILSLPTKSKVALRRKLTSDPLGKQIIFMLPL
jgi:serine/threonine protein kinase